MTDNHTQSSPRKDTWDIVKIVAGSVVVPLIVGVFAFTVNDSIRERDVRVRMVELAIDVLKAPATNTPADAALRSWAARLLNTYSGVQYVGHQPAGATVAVNSKTSAATFAGYAHVTVRSDPPGALVWFTPGDYPEVSIPSPAPTPTEMNLLAGPYTVTWKKGTLEKKSGVFVFYNRENVVTAKFK